MSVDTPTQSPIGGEALSPLMVGFRAPATLPEQMSSMTRDPETGLWSPDDGKTAVVYAHDPRLATIANNTMFTPDDISGSGILGGTDPMLASRHTATLLAFDTSSAVYGDIIDRPGVTGANVLLGNWRLAERAQLGLETRPIRDREDLRRSVVLLGGLPLAKICQFTRNA